MKKILQLVFGDVRNVVSVGLALACAFVGERWIPGFAGWILVVVILAAGLWQVI